MCPNVRSEDTCAKPNGDIPLAHPILEVRITKGMSMTSIIKTMRKDAIGRPLYSFT